MPLHFKGLTLHYNTKSIAQCSADTYRKQARQLLHWIKQLGDTDIIGLRIVVFGFDL